MTFSSGKVPQTETAPMLRPTPKRNDILYSFSTSTITNLPPPPPPTPSSAMQAQLRIARTRAARQVLMQRRQITTPPTTPAGPNTAVPPTPPPPSGASSSRPVLAPPRPATTGSSSVPPSGTAVPPPLPPPPPPPRRSGFFRRLILYTTVGALVFYPTSAFLSTRFESYREFFVNTFPGAEFVADYADDHNWAHFGASQSGFGALQGISKVSDDAEKKAAEARNVVVAKTKQVETAAKAKATEAAKAAQSAKTKVTEAAQSAKTKVVEAAKDATAKVQSEAASLKDRAVTATQSTVEAAKDIAIDAKDKVVEATSNVPFNLSDGVEGVVREAEKALMNAKDKAGQAVEAVKPAHKVAEAPEAPKAALADLQRPRELRPDTVKPQKPSYEGKTIYRGPPLPIGHEPPPGFYIPPLAPKIEPEEKQEQERLPLLVPKVKEFAAEEPIISQLASTIDSLTSSLSSPSTGPSAESAKILSRAQDDLSSLSKRLEDVKKTEKERLEKTVNEKTKEFEALLSSKEQEWRKDEAGMKVEWEQERAKMVDGWRKVLEKELEGQREGIEKRLREEVVSQGIELQRRWLRSIKSQVETERGGRLAKLESLTTSLKQLERITLDNSAVLDDNVRLHKIWSALRAVQAKAEQGDVAFEDELRVLKSLSTPSTGESTNDGLRGDSVIQTTLGQLEQSGIPQTGVKSFAALSSWFTNSVAPRVHSASLVPPPHEASVLSHLASATLSAFMFRPKAGIISGDDVDAVLARAEWCLGEKDLDGAAREINSLKGWPRKLADDWLREARKKLEVQQALEVVGTEATLSSLLLV